MVMVAAQFYSNMYFIIVDYCCPFVILIAGRVNIFLTGVLLVARLLYSNALVESFVY